MKEIIENLFGFIYLLSMGDYFFFIGTFLLIVLFIYVLYLIKCSDEEELNNEIDYSEEFDIEAVSKAIETDYKPETVTLTTYEIEQENNAIISYDELVKNKDRYNYNYDDEFIFNGSGDLSVKKFNLNDNNPDNLTENKSNLQPKLFSYDKEEAFLKALKELQNNL